MDGREESEAVCKEVEDAKKTASKDVTIPVSVESNKESSKEFNQEYTLAFLTSFGLFVVMGMRCNLGPGFDIKYSKSFAWIPTEVVLIDGAFHFGYILTQLPAAVFSYKYSSNRLFIIGVILSAFINLVLPGAINLGDHFLVCLRFLQGGVEGVFIPSLYRVWGLVLPEVKAFLIAIAFTGCIIGFALSFPLSRCLTWQISWEASFYVFGGLAIIWCGVWNYYVKEKSFDGETDKRFIIVPVISDLKLSPLPYKTILASRPLWALAFVTAGTLLSIYVFITTLNVYTPSPQYHFFTYEISFSILCVVMCLGLLTGGFLSDFLEKRNILAIGTIRKLIICGSVGMLLPIAFITHATKNVVVVTTAYSCSSFLFGSAFSGILTNALDLGKHYANITAGFTSFYSLSICMAIYIFKVQFSSHENTSVPFIIFISIVQIFGLGMYITYGSSYDQHWDLPPPPSEFIFENGESKQCEENVEIRETADSKLEETMSEPVKESLFDEPYPNTSLEENETNEEENEVQRLPVIVEGVVFTHPPPEYEDSCPDKSEEQAGKLTDCKYEEKGDDKNEESSKF